MSILYVVSDQEGAGKTALCASVAYQLSKKGREVAVIKLYAERGQSPGADYDVEVYRRLLGQNAPGWPLVLSGGSLSQKVLQEILALRDTALVDAAGLIVEGSCALAPAQSGQVSEALDAKVLVVARYKRDLAVSDLKSWQELLGDRLIGFVINGVTLYLGTEARARLLPDMMTAGLACLGLVPEDRRLLAVSVAQLAYHLGGRFIAGEDKADSLVEYLMVGGLGMDSGELYFGQRQDKAVIVRGDRPDLQMAALATPTACLVLTKGLEPIEYVKYEAGQERVPLVVVETDTLTTMDALNTVMSRARFDHPAKLDRYAALLEEHVDLPDLLRRAGFET